MVARTSTTVQVTRKVTELRWLGPFEVTGELGEGGSGKVYAIVRNGESLALKVLRDDLALSPRECRRFLEEAECMRRVEHSAIVPLVDAGTLDDGRPYLAMPLLEGETLAARLARGSLELATALRYFADLASAVSTIHRAGLIHRDIKPENVILCGTKGVKRPVLLDLGIARDAHASSSTTTEQGNIRGTRAYMAPERFFGAPATIATDVYELAVLLYIMLVGKAPWDSDESAASRLHPRDPEELGVVLSESLKTTLLRALSTRPEVRPASVDAFAEAVRQEAIDPPPTTGADPTRITGVVTIEASEPKPKPKRRPWLVGGGVVLAVSGLALFALRPEPRPVPNESSVASVVDIPPAPPSSVPTIAVEIAPTPSASVVDAPRPTTPTRAQGPRTAQPNRPPKKTTPAQAVASAAPPVPPPSAAPPPPSSDHLYGDRK